jgi:hypothetical protein
MYNPYAGAFSGIYKEIIVHVINQAESLLFSIIYTNVAVNSYLQRMGE